MLFYRVVQKFEKIAANLFKKPNFIAIAVAQNETIFVAEKVVKLYYNYTQ